MRTLRFALGALFIAMTMSIEAAITPDVARELRWAEQIVPLSVQMPVLAADAPRDHYVATFPDAGERLDAATDWLRARNYAHIGIVSHSMGAAMVNAWLARSRQPSIDAWVPVGLLVDFAAPPQVPVLDVVAERDSPEALGFAKQRARRLPNDGCSAPLVVERTDHYFGGAVPRLARAMKPFLERALGGNCTR